MTPELDALASRIRGLPGHAVGSGASIFDIADAEAMLAAPVEGHYREFLETFGWADLRSEGILGLGPGVPARLHLLAALQAARAMRPALPSHLLPVHLGAGNPYCLDTRVRGQPPVVLFDRALGDDQLPWRAAPSFAAWLSRLLDAVDPR